MNGPGDVVAGPAPPQEQIPAVAFMRPTGSPQPTGDAKGITDNEAPKSDGEENIEDQAFVGNALASYVWSSWSRNKRARDVMEERLLACLRARRGVYYTGDLQTMWTYGSGNPIYLSYAATKMRQAEAALRDLLLPDGERPWGLDPTSMPDLPPDVEASIEEKAAVTARQQVVNAAKAGGQVADISQFRGIALKLKEQLRDQMLADQRKEAKERAVRMEDAIDESMERGSYYQAMAEFIQHFCTFQVGILKGPFLQRKKRLRYDRNNQAVVTNTVQPTWQALDPFDCYPAPEAKTCQDGDFIERIRLSEADLYGYIGVPGYNEQAIRNVLANKASGSLRTWIWSDAERRALQGATHDVWISDYLVDALHFWGSVEGKTLIEHGITHGVDDPLAYYEVDAVLIGNEVIRCELNDDPLGRRPYFSASYDPVPGAFWGNAIFDLMSDCQAMINAAARAMNANLGLACVTGDTVVYRHPKTLGVGKKGKRSPKSDRKRADCEVTIRQLWENQRTVGRQRIRSLDEATGKFFGNKILRVLHNGVRPVYQLVTKAGYRIKATMDHQFINSAGEYQQLQDFKIGDLVAVNGSVVPLRKTCMDCGDPLKSSMSVRCRSCNGKAKYKPVMCEACGEPMGPSKSSGAKRHSKCKSDSPGIKAWNEKQAQDALTNTEASETTSRGRKLWRANMLEACQGCGTVERLELHHIDKNPMNCSPDNCMTLCGDCHKQWHVRHDHYGDPFKHVFVDFDNVTSITYMGEEEVFDLMMEGPNHNFVANGFAVHNCGPILGIDMSQLAAGQDPKALRPLQILQLDRSRAQAAANPLEFYQADSRSAEMMTIIEKFQAYADDLTGIPRYLGGAQDATGAAQTASGLSMLLGSAAKGLRRAVANIDRGVVSQTVEAAFHHEMLYNPDDTIKGDCVVSARGAAAVLVKEHLQQTRTQFLQMTANPIDMQIIGTQGRRAVLKSVSSALDMDTDQIFGTDQEFQQKQEQQTTTPPRPSPDATLKSQTDLQKERMKNATTLTKEGFIHPAAAAAVLGTGGAQQPPGQPPQGQGQTQQSPLQLQAGQGA